LSFEIGVAGLLIIKVERNILYVADLRTRHFKVNALKVAI